MRAAIGRDHDLALRAIEHQGLIQQLGLERRGGNLARQGHWIPVPRQDRPIRRSKGAAVRQRGFEGRKRGRGHEHFPVE
jgi:hypothetical protein